MLFRSDGGWSVDGPSAFSARMITLAVLQGYTALMFPIVKTTDLIVARVIVEAFSSILVVLCYTVFLVAIGVDISSTSAAAAKLPFSTTAQNRRILLS